MPELPEVETVRRGLVPHLSGQRLTHVEVFHSRAVRRHKQGQADFVAQLRDVHLGEPSRRGKYLWIPLSDGRAIVAHLGMSGQFQVQDEGSGVMEHNPHTRVQLLLQSGRSLLFIDPRTICGVLVEEMADHLPA